MPNNDRPDAFSVRGSDENEPRPDPRLALKAMEQETELELGWSEQHDQGGQEHQTPEERRARERKAMPANPPQDRSDPPKKS